MPSVSPAQSTSPTEPYRFGNVWRIDTVCRHCRVEMHFDSPDEMKAEDLWAEACLPHERGTMVPVPKPGEHAVRIALSSATCDHCLAQHEAAQQRHEYALDFDHRLNRAGLPYALRELDWAEMDREHGRRNTIVAARAWCESTSGKMLLYGGVGTGKTRLAATACWDRLQNGGECIWCSVPILLQQNFAPDKSPEKQRAVKALTGTGPLILDDLGKEKPGDWARQVLFGAIDSRLQAGSPILITSNFDPDGIADRLGEAVGSRLLEFRQYELAGRDRRGEETP